MVLSAMLCGIAFLSGCLLTLLFVPLVHKRAVRLTTRDVLATAPLTMAEIRTERDHLRAQFAMAIRRLEVNVGELQTKGAGQAAEIGRQYAEIRNLRTELEKRAALIIALRARWQARHAIARRVVRLLLYLFVRSGRRGRPTLLLTRQAAATIHAAPTSIIGREAA
jgi:hypothetical protein